VEVLNERVISDEATPSSGKQWTQDPDVFEYTDYRKYLLDLKESRVQQARPASNASFARRGGIESPNYWGLVLSGKRNLSPSSVHKFSRAAGLKGRSALYFENLVYFNQARRSEEKLSYFERLKTLSDGHAGTGFSILSSHVKLLSHWHIIAIRELVCLEDFQEDEIWISHRLRSKVQKREIREAIDLLLRLEFLRRDPATQKLSLSEPFLKYPESGANFAIRSLHLEFLDKARDSLIHDPAEKRNMTSTTFSINSQSLNSIKKEIDEFTDHICTKYGNNAELTKDGVVQMNTQLFYLTETKSSGDEGSVLGKEENHETIED
jgi:uncharacterized protein (TIGR02147 family)